MEDSKRIPPKPVGLLTFISTNYGACLQAFAGRKALEKLGFKVRFINYKCEANGFESSAKNARTARLLRMLTPQFYKRLKARKIYALKNEKFREFRSTHILTDGNIYSSKNDLAQLSSGLSAVVCGSDMIWSAEFEDILDIYMLQWCVDAAKISYAPSIGNIEAARLITDVYKNALKDFKALACREQSASDFVGSLLDRQVTTVCDPTLLFDAHTWQQWFNLKHGSGQPYALTYCFGGISQSMRKGLLHICEQKGWHLRHIIGSDLTDTLNEKKFGDAAYGPIEFLQLFYDAEFIVVNGYHGLLFALIFNKPFVLLHRERNEHWGSHENRMSELLTRLNLNDRYIDYDDVIVPAQLNLDYAVINDEISRMRQSGYQYLTSALQDL